jgi:WD40 repeat protein
MASPIQVTKTATLTGHRDCVYTLEQSDQPAVFYSASGDGQVAAWNLNNPDNGELLAKVSTSVYALRYLPGTHLLLVGHNHHGLQVIDIAEKTVKKAVPLPGGAFFDIAFSAVNQQIYIGSADGSLFILNAQDFSIKNIWRYAAKSLRSIAINENQDEVALGYSDNMIAAHANSVFTVAYSPDGRYLLSGSRDAHLKVWDAAQNYEEVTSIIAHLFTINHITFSPNGQYFATCSMDKSVKVWDAKTFRLLKVIDKARHAGHGTSVNKLFWSAHHNSLVSCSDDRTISVWDLKFS